MQVDINLYKTYTHMTKPTNIRRETHNLKTQEAIQKQKGETHEPLYSAPRGFALLWVSRSPTA